MFYHKKPIWVTILLVAILTLAGCGNNDDDAAPAATPAGNTVMKFAILDGAQEAPAAVTTTASGIGSLTVNDATGAASGSFTVLTAPATAISAAHVHEGAAGASGGVVIGLTDSGGGVWSVPAGSVLTASQIAAFTAGNLYFNVHTAANPGGEIRGQINKDSATLYARLDGAQEAPTPVTTTATATGSITVTAATGAITGSLTIGTAPATAISAAHVHQGARGASGGVVIGLTNSGGGVWSLPAGSVLTPAQMSDLFLTGKLYFNVHTAANGGGEIRGQLDLIAP